MSQFIRRCCCVPDSDDIPSSEYMALSGPESCTDYLKALVSRAWVSICYHYACWTHGTWHSCRCRRTTWQALDVAPKI